MRILIIRHGEPDYTIDSLTEKGWREAELLSQRLIKMKIDKFYCSPLGRAKDTAKPTLEKFGAEAEILPWLEEFRGKVEPHPKTKLTCPWDLHPSQWEEQSEVFDREKWTGAPLLKNSNTAEIYNETKDGVDSLLKKFGYVKNGMMFKCDDNRDITIALFCHFALGSAIVGYLMGVSPFIMWHSFFMPASSVTTLVSSEVRKGDIYFRCMQLGDTSHLYAAGEPVSSAGLMPEVFDPASWRNI